MHDLADDWVRRSQSGARASRSISVRGRRILRSALVSSRAIANTLAATGAPPKKRSPGGTEYNKKKLGGNEVVVDNKALERRV